MASAVQTVVTVSRARAALSQAGKRWAAARAKAKELLSRVATNFWDGTEEDPAQHAAGAAGGNGAKGDQKGASSYETQILENSIQKIGALLAVGFGDAGAEVIAENIRREGDINPMVPGRKTVAIFGFCDIRRFTDATEVLQEEVMEFVNSIARIVHTSVALHGGAANKNIGDAFLLVWKFPKGFTMRDIREAVDSAPPAGTLPTTYPTTSTHANNNNLALAAPVSAAGGLPDSLAHSLHATESGNGRAGAGSNGGSAAQWPGLGVTGAGGNGGGHSRGSIPESQSLISAASRPDSGGSSHHTSKPRRKSVQWDPEGNQVLELTAGSYAEAAMVTAGHSSSPAGPLGEATEQELAAGATDQQYQQPSTRSQPAHSASPSKALRFQSLGNNRVAPLPSGLPPPAVVAARSNGRLGSGGPGGVPGGGVAGEGGHLAPDEEAAIRKVMRMRSAGGARSSFTIQEKQGVVHAVADSALASFVVIHAALKRSARLARYARRADLAARLGEGWRVQMGFGLHVGWAIEGAIGSEYKIDASYLSPNVNMASRLEAATKQFGVSLLLSAAFVECLSPAVRQRVRQIDCVTVKGSTQPMGLFTYDVGLDAVPEVDPEVPGAEEEEEALWDAYVAGWATNEDLGATWGIDNEFRDEFAEGFTAYQSGQWDMASEVLSRCLTARRDAGGAVLEDGPSKVLLEYMRQYNNVAPPHWRGFRELTEK